MRIVLADDSSVEREQAKRMLSAMGHVIVAETDNGRDAVETVLRENPDVVVIDVVMRYMTGDVAGLELRRRGYDGAIVFATKNSQKAVRDNVTAANGALCVKMYRPDRLQGAIAEALAKLSK